MYVENSALSCGIGHIFEETNPNCQVLYSMDFYAGCSEFFVCLVEKEQFFDQPDFVYCVWFEIIRTFLQRNRNPMLATVVIESRDIPDPEDILKNAGRRLMDSIEPNVHLFESVQELSRTSYESKPCVGKIVLGDIPVSVPIQGNLKMDQIRMVRKLLEATSDRAFLVNGPSGIKGFAMVSDAPEDAEYSIIISGSSRWSFLRGKKTIFQMEGGNLRTPKSRDEFKRFCDVLQRAEIQMTSQQITTLYNDTISSLLKQKHGSILVVSEQAKEEAIRLQRNAILLDSPLKLSQELATSFSSVDGAILLDVSGECYAFGVIMDGEVDPSLGKPERGSRHNSTLRYIETQRKRGHMCMALVRSDDGMSDYFPVEST